MRTSPTSPSALPSPDREPGEGRVDLRHGAVVLTRASPDNVELAALLRNEGLSVVEWPATETRTVLPAGGADALQEALDGCDVIAFTSRRGVLAAAELASSACDTTLRSLLGTSAAAAVGRATAHALISHGVTPRWVSDGSGSAALGARLLDDMAAGCIVVLLRSAAADDSLPAQLTAGGLVVRDLRVYEQGAPPCPTVDRPIGIVTCASSSAARRVLAWHPWVRSARFVAIGRTTERCLRENGVEAVVVAAAPDALSMRLAILAALDEGDAT